MGKLDLNVSGSANMVINELQADKLECSINGSGTINLKREMRKKEHTVSPAAVKSWLWSSRS